MNIIYFNNQPIIECINPINKIYSITFSKFESDETDEEGNVLFKCCNEKLKGFPSTYDIQQVIINSIQEYAKTDTIKSAILSIGDNLYKGWLDSETRASLLGTIKAKEASGLTNITIWFGNNAIDLNCKEAVKFINTIELYSSTCFNTVQTKIDYIKSIDDVKRMTDFNIITGYPTIPVFTVN